MNGFEFLGLAWQSILNGLVLGSCIVLMLAVKELCRLAKRIEQLDDEVRLLKIDIHCQQLNWDKKYDRKT